MSAAAPMDEEQVIAATQGAMEAAMILLELLHADPRSVAGQLRAGNACLGEALHASLSWTPGRSETDEELMAILDRWLP